MSEMKNYTIKVLNDRYIVQSDEQEDFVLKTAQLVDMFAHEILEKNKHIDHKKVAVLAALRLAGQVIHMENKISNIHHKECEIMAVMDTVC